MGSISFREHIRWLPDEASEPTSTIVLTSPQRRFVDLRILKSGPSAEAQESHATDRLEWGIAGTSSSSLVPDGKGGEVRHSRWEHWIDSRTTDPESAADEGDMYPQDGGDLTLEKGRMVNPATGRECDYEELWRDVDPEPAAAAAARDAECVVLQFEDEPAGARGSVVWLGRFCQGISRVGGDVTAERWEWKEDGGWKRTARLGGGAELPCEVLLKTGAQLSVGAHVKHGDAVWDVVESNA